jgi:hypothetical protein
MLIGYCVFGSPDAALLVSLLPQLVHVRGERRLGTLSCSSWEKSPASGGPRVRSSWHACWRFFSSKRSDPRRRLGHRRACCAGLPNERLAAAIRRMHESPTKAVDGCAVGERGSVVPLGVLRAIQPRSGRRPDGVPARLAHGLGKEPAATEGSHRRRSRGRKSATAPRAPSASHSLATSDCRQHTTRGRRSRATRDLGVRAQTGRGDDLGPHRADSSRSAPGPSPLGRPTDRSARLHRGAVPLSPHVRPRRVDPPGCTGLAAPNLVTGCNNQDRPSRGYSLISSASAIDSASSRT